MTTRTKTPPRSEIAQLKREIDALRRKNEFLEEELRVARATEQTLARRASYGVRYQQ